MKYCFILNSRAGKGKLTEEMKNKIENAQEVLQSCKKILSRRMQEMELTRIGGSGK